MKTSIRVRKTVRLLNHLLQAVDEMAKKEDLCDVRELLNLLLELSTKGKKKKQSTKKMQYPDEPSFLVTKMAQLFKSNRSYSEIGEILYPRLKASYVGKKASKEIAKYSMLYPDLFYK